MLPFICYGMPANSRMQNQQGFFVSLSGNRLRTLAIFGNSCRCSLQVGLLHQLSGVSGIADEMSTEEVGMRDSDSKRGRYKWGAVVKIWLVSEKNLKISAKRSPKERCGDQNRTKLRLKFNSHRKLQQQ